MLLKERSRNLLNTISAEEINEKAKNPESFVTLCENEFNKKIHDIKKYIKSKGIRFVYISGPSASGKTTFTKKLKEGEKDTITISLDDYFKSLENMPRKKDGEMNFESVNSIDLKALKTDFSALKNGEKVHLPALDFNDLSRSFSKESVSIKDNTLVIIEGLHALNPKIYKALGDGLKIFISPMTELTYRGKTASVYDIRFIRRVVRDSFFRNARAAVNIKMWPQVRAGEKIYMQSYKRNADFLVDTFVPYELCIMKPYIEELLSEVESTPKTRRILSLASSFTKISETLIPENSIMKEFIK